MILNDGWVLIVNIEKIKGVSCAIFTVMFLTGMIVFIYNKVGPDTLKLIKGEDYIYYDWKQIPVFLFLPVAIAFDFFILIIMVLPSCRKKIGVIVQRLIMPVTIYSVAAFFIGSIASMVISICPLGTDYYKCDSTSIVSSGSHYAKSKGICKERAYSSISEGEIQKTK